MECLTDEIEKRAQEYIEKIDAMGGALAAIESGYMQRESLDSAYRWQRAVDHKEQIVVGVSEFTLSETNPLRLLRVDPAVREKQMARLHALKQRLDDSRVKALLQELEQTALGHPPEGGDGRYRESGRRDENLLTVILECVESYATLGEICGVLRRVFGEYKPTMAL